MARGRAPATPLSISSRLPDGSQCSRTSPPFRRRSASAGPTSSRERSQLQSQEDLVVERKRSLPASPQVPPRPASEKQGGFHRRRPGGSFSQSVQRNSAAVATSSRRTSRESLKSPEHGGVNELDMSKSKSEDFSEAHHTTRRLSFVDCTLGQIQAAIMETRNESAQCHIRFWDAILAGRPSPLFKALQNRTLSFWVKCFNKWLQLKGGKGVLFDLSCGSVNGCQLQEMTRLSMIHLIQVVELYDPQVQSSLQTEGNIDPNLLDVRIPAMELMIAGVMLSKLISTKNKLSFAFGIVDLDSTRSLCRRQFAMFINAFIRGLGAAFAVPGGTMPTSEEIHTVVCLLYDRIGNAAASRIKGMFAKGSIEVKKAVVSAIKARQNGVSQQAVPFADPNFEQCLPYDVLRDWCCGTLLDQDPLGMPFHLAIQRFCSVRLGNFADEFDENLQNFTLSYDRPVQLPNDSSTVIDSKNLLNRAEVAFIHEVLKHCRQIGRIGSKRLGGGDINRVVNDCGTNISRRMKSDVSTSIEELANQLQCDRGRRLPGGGANCLHFVDVVRKVCPMAQPKHLRMYEVWRDEYKQLSAQRAYVEGLEQAATVYIANEEKPFLPEVDLRVLEREFDQLDRFGKGYISMEDIAEGWNWSHDIASDTVAAFGQACDGYIDKMEFLRMMCPPEYRLHEMSGPVREFFGQLLFREADVQRKSVKRMEARFSDATVDGASLPLGTPRALARVVEPDMWAHWQHVFDHLDKNADGRVEVGELLQCGLLSPTVCHALAELIDPADTQGFNRRAFLEAMLTLHGCREPLNAT